MAKAKGGLSAVDQIYLSIKEKLENRIVECGERLNIEELAKEYGVSRTPVREAINRLTQEGLVEQRHNFGPCVIRLDYFQEVDIIEANGLLLQCIFDSLRVIDDLSALKTELSEVYERQRLALERDDLDAYNEASTAFHLAIISHCSNEIIKKFAYQTQYQLNLVTLGYQDNAEMRKSSTAEHGRVLEAILRDDLSAASALMKEHNDIGLRIVLQRQRSRRK